MKKLYLIVLSIFWGLCPAISANNINISLIPDGNLEEYCVELTDTIVVSVDTAWENHLQGHQWLLRGDLKFAKDYGVNSNPCKIVTPAGGYGKGRISYKYSTGGCAQAEDIDIYKSFIPTSDMTIEGPACVAAGDIVVFSVDPILTVNLNDQIGMDNYYWNVTDTANGHKLPFVDSLYYKAGDGSSVTFSVKEWGNTTPEIELYLGDCNKNDPNKKISLTLVKQAPKPEFEQYEYCLPYGEQELELAIQNAQSSVQYSWDLPIGWSIVTSNTDSTIVTIKSDNSTIGDIVVSAAYKSDDIVECAITQTNLTINRLWGNSTNIPQVGCLNAGSENYTEFSIQGDIPTRTGVHWVINSDYWNIKDNDIHSPRIFAKPRSNAPLSDTIFVYEVSQCPNSNYPIKHDSIIVYFNPAAVHIEGEECVESNSTETFYAVRNIDAIGPDAYQYEWIINGDTSRVSTPYIDYTIPTGVSTIVLKMRPLGLSNCKVSQYSTFTTAVRPERTQGITRLDTTCIPSGTNGVIEIQLENASSEQTYAWDFSHTRGYERMISYDPNGNKSRIKVITTGFAGNDTILGFAEGSAGCRDTEPDTLIVTTAAVPFSLYINGEGRTRYEIFSNPVDLTEVFDSVAYYEWKIDGEIEDEGEDVYDISVRKTLVSSTSIVELTVTTGDNCTYTAKKTFAEASTNNNANPSMTHGRNQSYSAVVKNESFLQLSPNPVNEILHIELPVSDAYKTVYRIYDTAGKLQLRIVADDNATSNIDVSKLIDGTYILVANQDGALSSGKFVVKH